MAAGNRWRLPDGREALEVSRQGNLLRVMILSEDWPFPGPPITVDRDGATLMPSKYLKGAIPKDDE